MRENLVMTSAYESIRTDSGSRGKKLSKVGKGVPTYTLRLVFGAKLTILWATNGIARVKI